MQPDANQPAHHDMLPQVMDTIKKIARSYRMGNHTMQTTEIVHEGYLRLVKEDADKWHDKNRYMQAFAISMRRFLVDRYRKKISLKRGGTPDDLSYEEMALEFPAPEGFVDWLDLDHKLNRLHDIDPLAAEVVQLKFFTGLSIQEMTQVLHHNATMLNRKWTFAKAWLKSALSETT
ncbi:ECF-type sigma factor [Marinicella meishanensis]|uniref:ECF-type sigma factor n=1 Tax=Marinicella meishanensis TaxID=2873263 RepID=UPI001CBD40FC|nr:ECF-type sigma factor [Marinicella sp. NBU2979]